MVPRLKYDGCPRLLPKSLGVIWGVEMGGEPVPAGPGGRSRRRYRGRPNKRPLLEEIRCYVTAVEGTLLATDQTHQGEAKIRQLQVPVLIDKKVVGLKVAVDNSSPMKMLHAKNDLAQVFLHPVLREAAEDFDQRGAVAAIKVLHHQVQVVLAGKGPIELCDKIALALPHHDGAFRLDVGDLVLGDHVRLLEDFDGKVLPVDFFFDRYTLPKAPLLIGLMISKSLMDGGTARA